MLFRNANEEYTLVAPGEKADELRILAEKLIDALRDEYDDPFDPMRITCRVQEFGHQEESETVLA
jgi:hypothetical protein